ncbi:nucleoplasmin-2 isoform X1 [Cavia porcellus]|uniref:nucleoplasmin-2 isoform X1 n=1 Tax=Cavia porcellus TaxID=10141 RepID=UPI002FE2197B
MSHRSTSSLEDKAERTVPWGAELNFERRICTFRPQAEEDSCRLVLSAICLGEKAKEEVNRVEIVPSATPEDKRPQTITIATLKLSVLPMVAMAGISLSPPVTFQLRAGSGPVFLSGQECHYGSSDLWQEEEEGEEEEEDDDDEEEDEETDVSIEDTPSKLVKRLVPQKQTSVAKKKKVEKEEEDTARRSVYYKTPSKKGKSSERSRKLEAKKKSTSDTP